MVDAGFEPGTCGLVALDLNDSATMLLRLCSIYIGYILLHIGQYYAFISSQQKQL